MAWGRPPAGLRAQNGVGDPVLFWSRWLGFIANVRDQKSVGTGDQFASRATTMRVPDHVAAIFAPLVTPASTTRVWPVT